MIVLLVIVALWLVFIAGAYVERKLSGALADRELTEQTNKKAK
jgi:hypothetical protein